MSFNETALGFAASNRWDGTLDPHTHEGLVGVPGDGPYVHIQLYMKDRVVQRARFETYTCPAARASCAALCWAIEGKSAEICEAVCAKDVVLLIQGLPEGKGHLPEMAVEALHKALQSGTEARKVV